jgi:transcriptional regulator with XRE-family HTH domain
MHYSIKPRIKCRELQFFNLSERNRKGKLSMPGKKAAQATPNYMLRRARQERGWSQQEVADRIGAPQSFLVTRWERGTALPGAHYRQKLCELFGKSAFELGLLQVDPVTSILPNPQVSIFDPAIPLPLTKTHALVGRDSLLVQLKQQLCASENVALTALNGIPGVGKTALAVALANDADVQESFRDGILWAGLGPEPNVIGLLSRWGKLLGMAENEITGLRTGDDWAMALHALIGKRHLLLIIDDAWTGEVYFKQGQLDAASQAYNDLLESAPQGNREMFAVAHYGLAQIAAMHNELSEARRMGRASLDIFEEIKHPKAAEARDWLAALSAQGSDDEQ